MQIHRQHLPTASGRSVSNIFFDRRCSLLRLEIFSVGRARITPGGSSDLADCEKLPDRRFPTRALCSTEFAAFRSQAALFRAVHALIESVPSIQATMGP